MAKSISQNTTGQQVAKNFVKVTWITKSGYKIIRVLFGRSNVFLLTNGRQNILIDTSPGFMWPVLDRQLKKLDVTRIDYLILTHSHFDHAANAGRIKEEYHAQIIVSKYEADFLKTGENPMARGTNILTHAFSSLLGKKVLTLLRNKPCSYDILVDSILDLRDFGFEAYIIHTPGHTIGSMSIVVDDEVAIVGDAMFGVFRWSVFPPFANDIKQMVESWGKLLETNCTIFLPSHGSANSRSLVQRTYICLSSPHN